MAAATVPWSTEAEVYRSDLADLLPEGLTHPAGARASSTSTSSSSSIWLEEVPAPGGDAGTGRGTSARRTSSAGSRPAAPWRRSASCAHVDWTLDTYATGRLEVQVVPMLMSDEIWQHPLCAAFDDELRDRLRATAGRTRELAAEADALPDAAQPRRRLPQQPAGRERDDDCVMIDFGFWGGAPVAFDLTQLLVGDVQIGRRSAEGLAELDEALVTAYVAGLRDEGCEVPEAQVRRAHALCLLLMTGLSTAALRPVRGTDHPRDPADRGRPGDRGPLRVRPARGHLAPEPARPAQARDRRRCSRSRRRAGRRRAPGRTARGRGRRSSGRRAPWRPSCRRSWSARGPRT